MRNGFVIKITAHFSESKKNSFSYFRMLFKANQTYWTKDLFLYAVSQAFGLTQFQFLIMSNPKLRTNVLCSRMYR